MICSSLQVMRMLLQVSLLMILLTSSGGTPYYITPSDDIIAGNNTCFFEGRPLQPCSTLETLTEIYTPTSIYQNSGPDLMVLFLPGNYSVVKMISLNFTSLQNVILSPLNESGSAIKIKCKAKMFINILQVRKVIIKSLEFYFCSGIRYKNAMNVRIFLEILNSSFTGNHGSAIVTYGESESVTLIIIKSKFELIKNSRGCGAVCAVHSSRYEIYSASQSKLTVAMISNTFANNLGTVLYINGDYGHTAINVTKSIFANNTSNQYGAAMDITVHWRTLLPPSAVLIINNCLFHNNTAKHSGGAIDIDIVGSDIIITNCRFQFNTATKDGGAVELFLLDVHNKAIIANCTFVANRCGNKGGGILYFHTNTERFHVYKCVLELENVTFQGNSAKIGGGICLFSATKIKKSVLRFTVYSHSMGITNATFRDNSAQNGGAISIENTTLYTDGDIVFINNKADANAGALEASRSNIHSANAITFRNNSAGRRGGALFLIESSLGGRLYFIGNIASLGGAIFIDDFTDSCENNRTCFSLESMYFQDNRAKEGALLYGGISISCMKFHSEIQKYMNMSSAGNSLVASNLVDICFCDDQQRPDCSLRHKNVSVIRGESIQLMITTMDKYQNFKSSYLKSCDDSRLTLGRGECQYYISNACSRVNFHAYSKLITGDIVLKSDARCTGSKLTVQVKFQPCPQGFQLALNEDSCECDKRLKDIIIGCHISNKTIQKIKNSWFHYYNNTLEVCQHCPLDYCNENASIPIADVKSQCANNRSGIICGACKELFSIALGSSNCIECHGAHKYAILWLVPLFAIMGLILVLNMLFLDLTVSIGLINGLIFYANILSISGLINNYNCSIHPLLSVFISWINLDFGIETCSYSGMDMYQKTWLQFSFPLYIWLLVGLIIILSHYSTRVMRLLGRKVIPVLATLFLLSYAKILKTIITALYFIEVLRGNADNISDELVSRKVWTHDGTVDYLSGKHIPLFIVALLFLVVLFLPYTLFLTFGQCLRTMSKKRRLRWLRTTTFISIMDAYHAPFNRKHRYWTGLLLLIRCILLLVSVFNQKTNVVTSNMFVVTMIIIALLVLKTCIEERIYRTRRANILENVFLLNLGLLAATSYYLDDSDGLNVCQCLTASISVAFVTFFIIIVYHISYKVKGYNAVQRVSNKINAIRKVKSFTKNLPPEPKANPPTTTFVELREALLESAEHN